MKRNNTNKIVNESMNKGFLTIEEAEQLTLENVRKIYEQNGKL